MNREVCGTGQQSSQACNEESVPCSASPASQAVLPISLQDAVARFEKEASPGQCDTGRYQCRYFSWGQGSAVVMIPGIGNDARAYIPLAALLAQSCRCIL